MVAVITLLEGPAAAAEDLVHQASRWVSWKKIYGIVWEVQMLPAACVQPDIGSVSLPQKHLEGLSVSSTYTSITAACA